MSDLVTIYRKDADGALDALRWATREMVAMSTLMDEEGIPATTEDGAKLTVGQRVDIYVKSHRAARVAMFKAQQK